MSAPRSPDAGDVPDPLAAPAQATPPGSPPVRRHDSGAPPFYLGKPVLPNYRGDPFSLKDFQESFQSIFSLYSLPPNQQVLLLLGQLQGPAREEVRTWPTSEKTTVDQIFEGLHQVFESHSPSEVRLRLYERRQKPGETLRAYAVALQNALEAVQKLDNITPDQGNKLLMDRFIEGVQNKWDKAQLKMLAVQNPNMSFSAFKRLALQVIEQGASPEEHPDPKTEPMGAAACPAPLLPPAPAPVAVTPASTTITEIQEVRQDIAQLTQVVKELANHTTRVLREPPETRRPTPAPPPRSSGPRSGPSSRPYCDFCDKPGHWKMQCWALNGRPLRSRTGPQENESQVQQKSQYTQDSPYTLHPAPM